VEELETLGRGKSLVRQDVGVDIVEAGKIRETPVS